MALGLTQNASTANQFCVPCCHGAMGRCCTPELIANDTESLFITFYNFEQFSGNDWVSINIDNFSAELKRVDFVGDYDISYGQNYKYSNYLTGAQYISQEGFTQTNPGSTNTYYLTSRLIPVNLTIVRKTYVENNGLYPIRYLPLEGYDKNSNYFADIRIECLNLGYRIFCQFIRTPVEHDDGFGFENPEGLLLAQTVFGSTIFDYYSVTDHCEPQLIHGNATNNLNGFWGTNYLANSPGIAYFDEQFFINNQWIHQSYFNFNPSYQMKYFVTS